MAKKKRPTYKIPFDGAGNLIDWAGYGQPDYTKPPHYRWVPCKANDPGAIAHPYTQHKYSRQEPYGEWRDYYEFDDVLEIQGIHRGRSAAQFILRGSEGERYNMFMTDMEDVIRRADIHKGMVAGTWTFVKRGTNYGIKLKHEQ